MLLDINLLLCSFGSPIVFGFLLSILKSLATWAVPVISFISWSGPYTQSDSGELVCTTLVSLLRECIPQLGHHRKVRCQLLSSTMIPVSRSKGSRQVPVSHHLFFMFLCACGAWSCCLHYFFDATFVWLILNFKIVFLFAET